MGRQGLNNTARSRRRSCSRSRLTESSNYTAVKLYLHLHPCTRAASWSLLCTSVRSFRRMCMLHVYNTSLRPSMEPRCVRLKGRVYQPRHLVPSSSRNSSSVLTLGAQQQLVADARASTSHARNSQQAGAHPFAYIPSWRQLHSQSSAAEEAEAGRTHARVPSLPMLCPGSGARTLPASCAWCCSLSVCGSSSRSGSNEIMEQFLMKGDVVPRL